MSGDRDGSGSPPIVLYLVTEDWYFVSHRLPLAVAAREAGYRPIVATRISTHADTIRAQGVEVIPIGLARASRNPFAEAATVLELTRLYRTLRPAVVHHVALKPVLYGTMAAALTGVPLVVNAVAGLGSLFIAEGGDHALLRQVVRRIYGASLRFRRGICVVQNPDDGAFVARLGVPAERIALIRGAGVDLQAFAPAPEPDGPPVVILPARLLRDKGVEEFVAAARLLRQEGVTARFALVGAPDPANPTGVPPAQIEEWGREGVVELWGHRADMPQVFREAHIVCLPSYREGLPKALLEAAAAGRPIVATDVPGCREIVRPGQNGILVSPRSPAALADALRTMIRDAELRARLGAAGRLLVEQEFSIEKVAAATVALYRRGAM